MNTPKATHPLSSAGLLLALELLGHMTGVLSLGVSVAGHDYFFYSLLLFVTG